MKEMMLIIMAFIIFILMFILPFVPGIFELILKKDAAPLFISMEYIRNPRYFGRSFKGLLHKATAGFTLSPGLRDIRLSKDEKIEITGPLNIPAKKEINNMLYIIGGLISGNNVQYKKEAYVIENADIGHDNTIQAMAGDGNIVIGERVNLLRWIDANGDIVIGEGGDLGISVSSDNKLCLARNCLFRRLFGMPIATGPDWLGTIIDSVELESLPESSHRRLSFKRKTDTSVPQGTVLYENVVFTGDVKIGKDSVLKGSIKSYGKLTLEENVTVLGNIFAEGDIIIGVNARIGGHVFSQASIYIAGRTVISCMDTIKSVIGKKSIRIEQNVIIYGYVTTEGEGKIL